MQTKLLDACKEHKSACKPVGKPTENNLKLDIGLQMIHFNNVIHHSRIWTYTSGCNKASALLELCGDYWDLFIPLQIIIIIIKQYNINNK